MAFSRGATSESSPINTEQDRKNTNRMSDLNDRRRHRFPFDTYVPTLSLSFKSRGTEIDDNIRNAALNPTLATSLFCIMFFNYLIHQLQLL